MTRVDAKEAVDFSDYLSVLGRHINDVLIDAQKIATQNVTTVKFIFNEIDIRVCRHSELSLLYRDYTRAIAGCISSIVGPYPSKTLTSEELASDEAIRAANRAAAQASRAAYEQLQAQKRAAVEKRLEAAPELKITEPELWSQFLVNNQSSFGADICAVACRCGRLMQLAVLTARESGEAHTARSVLTFEARQLFLDANFEGVSGTMQSIVEQLLIETWVYGPELEFALRSPHAEARRAARLHSVEPT